MAADDIPLDLSPEEAFELISMAEDGIILTKDEFGTEGLEAGGHLSGGLVPLSLAAGGQAQAQSQQPMYTQMARNAKKDRKGRKSAGTVVATASRQPKGVVPFKAATRYASKGFEGPKDVDTEPYRVGSLLVVRYVDGSERVADIIHVSAVSTADGAFGDGAEAVGISYRYYVHYHEVNRRMDEWVGAERILRPPSQAVIFARIAKEERERERREAEMRSAMESAEAAEAAMRSRRHKRKTSDGEDDEPLMPVPGNIASVGGGGPLVGAALAGEDSHDEHEGMDEASLREHEEVTKVKNVNAIELGRYRMECWYFSPFPKEYFPHGHIDVLYFCEFSMRFFRHKSELRRYQMKHLQFRHPPGNEIYRHKGLAMFEVDGAVEGEYCQNLCYLAKLFLDHKTLYFDVDPFLFYIMCEIDEYGAHPVGYFSKEKYSDVGYNLACILTFPCHQRKGYGRFLINFSYELSRKEEKVGSPEKPLSDLGAVSYRSFWSSILIYELRRWPSVDVTVMDLCLTTSFKAEDVIATLNHLNLLKCVNGQHIVVAEPAMLDELAGKYPIKEPVVDPSLLHWTPLVTADGKRDKFSYRSKRQEEGVWR